LYRKITTTNKTNTKQLYFVKDYTKDEAIKILINFWHKWGHTRERPLFIDAHLDVED